MTHGDLIVWARGCGGRIWGDLTDLGGDLTVRVLTDAKIPSKILSDKVCAIPVGLVIANMIADAHFNGPGF